MSSYPTSIQQQLHHLSQKGWNNIQLYGQLFWAILSRPLRFADRALANNTTLPLSPLAYLGTAFLIVALFSPLQLALSQLSGVLEALAEVLGLPPGWQPPRELPGVTLIRLSELTGFPPVDRLVAEATRAAVYGSYAWALWQLLGRQRLSWYTLLACICYSFGTLLVASELIDAGVKLLLILGGGGDANSLVHQYMLLSQLNSLAIVYFVLVLPARWLSYRYGTGFAKTLGVLVGGFLFWGLAMLLALQLVWRVTGIGIEFF